MVYMLCTESKNFDGKQFHQYKKKTTIDKHVQVNKT